MTKLIHKGIEYPFMNGDSQVNYIKIEIAPAGGSKFIKFNAILDTGSSCTTLTKSIIKELEICGSLPNLGYRTTETANGEIQEQVIAVNIRVIDSMGSSALFQNLQVSISESMDEPLFGMDLLQYFNLQMKNGEIVCLTFDDNSPAGIQKKELLKF